MPIFPYRALEPVSNVTMRFTQWIHQLDEKFTQYISYDRRSEIVHEELQGLFAPRTSNGGGMGSTSDAIVQLSLDPRNITVEPEYYGDIDALQYNPRKPLIYLWQKFDRSPLVLNHWLGFRFRAMLGRHIFRHIGSNVKLFYNVEFSFGYNLVIEDNCIIHKNVLLDDRGGRILWRGTSVSDYANIYSHTHDIHEQANVTNKLTEVGPAARIAYHATVLAGAQIGKDAMLGTMAVATRGLAPHVVGVGIPAKVIRVKDRGQMVRSALMEAG